MQNRIEQNPEKKIKEIAKIIRGLSMDGVQSANSGHPGMPMGMADVMSVLWSDFLKHNPSNPDWFDRDRFVLSGGHGSMLLYSALHLYGYDLSLDDLKNFRQWHSKTPGHPEFTDTPGVETTTGPLGQGIGNAVGFALAEHSLASRFNTENHKIIDHYTYVMCGDGDLEEGISHEVCSFAGHNKLSKLIILYDDNNITIDGKTELSFSENIEERFSSYGFQVQKINGHDITQIRTAIKAAQQSDKPSIICCKTVIGFGSPNKAGTHDVHGAPLGKEEVIASKKELGLPENEMFFVSENIKTLANETKEIGLKLETDWKNKLKAYKESNEDLAQLFTTCLEQEVSDEALNLLEFESGSTIATRNASGKVLDQLSPKIPALIGGSADLTPSNKTFPKSETSYSLQNPTGRYIHFGVREHGMGAIMNGMSLHGGMIPYGGTFFVFTDYMRPAMRMAAIMGIQVIYVLTHDSIGLGEDGPTHQPIAHLDSLRAMPNMAVVRPMDGNETNEAWKFALRNTTGPTCLVLTRQNLVNQDRTQYRTAALLHRGAYVLTEDPGFDTILMGSGSEVEIALEAKKKLNDIGIKVRVVSMPCFEIFEVQTDEYKEEVFPQKITKRVAIEAAAGNSYYKYVGLKGKVIGLNRFGASAPYDVLYEKLGITSEAIVEAVTIL